MVYLKNKKYFTVKEAATFFGYHPDYLLFLIREKRIKAERVPSSTFWQTTRSSITAYCLEKKKSIKSFYLKDTYISLKQASKISNYSADYIGSLLRNGKIEGRRVRLQTSWRIKREELEKYKLLKDKKLSAKERTKKHFFKSLKKSFKKNTTSRYGLVLGVSALVILLLVSSTSYLKVFQNLFKSTLAQKTKTINLYPSMYSDGQTIVLTGLLMQKENLESGWKNLDAVFSQDLKELATIEEFNVENSAYPFFSEEDTEEINLVKEEMLELAETETDTTEEEEITSDEETTILDSDA